MRKKIKPILIGIAIGVVVLGFGVLALGCNSIVNSISEPVGPYDFRQSNWGDLKEKVMFSERNLGTAPRDFGHVLVYKSTLWDIPVKIIYSFDNKKRLRSAGYITEKPTYGVRNIKEYALELHGEPSNQSSAEGIGWVTKNSMIYLQVNERLKAISPYIHGGGPLSYLSDQNEGPKTLYWDGVWGYVDLTFLDELHSTKQLNYYEKRLFGIMRVRTTFILKGRKIEEIPELYDN